MKCTTLNLRVLRSEIEELEELEKERDKYYESKSSEISEFRGNLERVLMESRIRVQELRNSVNEVN